jgi:hypothetical protein
MEASEMSDTAWTCERQDGSGGDANAGDDVYADIYWAIHDAQTYDFIANVHSNEKHARLIAAAPDVLNALRHLTEAADKINRQGGRSFLMSCAEYAHDIIRQAEGK